MKPAVIYHANCLDGFGAAYAAWRHYGDGGVDFVEGKHGRAIPELKREQALYFVDFSYERKVMSGICRQVKAVTVIDHHISAFRDLEGLDDELDNLTLAFDMKRSGAVMAWEFFHNGVAIPELLLDIQDRDIWTNVRPDSKNVTTALGSYPFKFEVWHQWVESGAEGYQQLRQEGENINRYVRKMIEHYKESAVMGEIAGYQVPVVNAPSELMSELLGELSVGHPFAAGYIEGDGKRSWSLRSDGERGADVSRVAAQFGGGGHRNASGFSTPAVPTMPQITGGGK